MKKVTFAIAAVLAGQFALTTPLYADGLQITPGLWRITSTNTNMMGQPQTKVEEQCMQEETFDPVSELQDGADNCTIGDQSLVDNTLTFTLNCAGPGGPQMTGNGRYSIDGNKGDGEMTYSMSFGGQSMTMTNSWVAERIGDCS